ncbi:zinc finger protein 692-like isoform X2 [Protopterus annectens]|nr:zinc finger protein 692-like isoform X2 [Protopterus annectens]
MLVVWSHDHSQECGFIPDFKCVLKERENKVQTVIWECLAGHTCSWATAMVFTQLSNESKTVKKGATSLHCLKCPPEMPVDEKSKGESKTDGEGHTTMQQSHRGAGKRKRKVPPSLSLVTADVTTERMESGLVLTEGYSSEVSKGTATVQQTKPVVKTSCESEGPKRLHAIRRCSQRTLAKPRKKPCDQSCQSVDVESQHLQPPESCQPTVILGTGNGEDSVEIVTEAVNTLTQRKTSSAEVEQEQLSEAKKTDTGTELKCLEEESQRLPEEEEDMVQNSAAAVLISDQAHLGFQEEQKETEDEFNEDVLAYIDDPMDKTYEPPPTESDQSKTKGTARLQKKHPVRKKLSKRCRGTAQQKTRPIKERILCAKNPVEEGQGRFIQKRIRKAAKKELLLCEYIGCGKIFSNRQYLNHHVKYQHVHQKTFCCIHPDCGKSFNFKKHLKEHEKLHSDKRDYICEFCARAFRTSSNLVIHRRIHTGEKPLQCEVCGFTCRQKASLNWHMKKHDAESTYQFSCDICGKRFEKRDNVTAHKSKSHADDAVPGHSAPAASPSTPLEYEDVPLEANNLKAESKAKNMKEPVVTNLS